MIRTQDRTAFGDLVWYDSVDDARDVGFVRGSPVGCVRPERPGDFAGDPMGDATCSRLCVDLKRRYQYGIVISSIERRTYGPTLAERIRGEVTNQRSRLTRSKNDEDTSQLRSIEDRLESSPVIEVYHATRRVCGAHCNTMR